MVAFVRSGLVVFSGLSLRTWLALPYALRTFRVSSAKIGRTELGPPILRASHAKMDISVVTAYHGISDSTECLAQAFWMSCVTWL